MPRAPQALTLLACCCLPLCLASQYDPHPPAGLPSWFEGWYRRLMPFKEHYDEADGSSPAGGPASLSLIIGTQPNAPPSWSHTLVSMTVQNSSVSNPTPNTYTRLGAALGIAGTGGSAASSNPDWGSPPALSIDAADGSLKVRMQGDTCLLEARLRSSEGEAEGEEAHLLAECTGPPMRWDSTGAGPEGCAASLPSSVTGIHWFVHSLATPMKFKLTQGSRPPVHGHALSHWEKNWGRSFPTGWYWSQGANATRARPEPAVEVGVGTSSSASPDVGHDGAGDASSSSSSGGSGASGSGGSHASVQAAFALAGGPPPVPLLPENWLADIWLLGVRTPTFSWDLHGFDSVFTAQADPCQATLLVSATQPLRRRAVDVQITTRPSTFAELEGPTRQGFRPYMHESLAAYAVVRLFEYSVGPHERGWVQKRLLEAWEFEGAALEFGGDRRCPEGDRHSSSEGAGVAVETVPVAVQ